ncbi:MAG: PKD domain-containing protein, partial [Bacteroidales bacterium]
MKPKIITLAIILLSSIATFAQTYNVINGTVINAITSTPVQNQAVYIVADSTNSMYSYYNIVYTNQNGFYADTIYSAPYQTTFYVSTSGCNGAMATGSVVSSYQGILTLNFTVQCNPPNPANCTADFYIIPDSINSNSGNALAYYFYDLSNPSGGSITSWYWDFGDGSHCIMPNTSHTYSSPGWYNVCLTIATDSGCTATYCDSMYADTISPCQAHFQYNVSNTSVSFYGYSNVSGVTYSWSFGDSTTSTNQNPIHSYMNYGTYTVCLTITNANGCTNTYCQTVVIANPVNCMAYFYTTQDTMNSNPGLFYQFYDLSNPSGGSITSWYWDFGDGSHCVMPNTSHT